MTATVCSSRPPRYAWWPARVHGASRHAARSSLVGQQSAQQRLIAAVVDLAGEVLQKAVELVEVAVRRRQEAGGIDVRRRLRTGDLRDLDHELVAEPLDDPDHLADVTALELAPERVGVLKCASRDAAGLVAQFEREIGRARARHQAVLARAREQPVRRALRAAAS